LLPVRRGVPRVYADTSVFGGVCDPGFETASRTFFERVRMGEFRLVTSALVKQELASAPPEVREFAVGVLPLAEEVSVSEEVVDLQAAYLTAGIVGPRRAADSLHVALATVAGCSVLVSWNFKHIVHFRKIPQYNAINTVNGYQTIAIHSPPEVGGESDEDP